MSAIGMTNWHHTNQEKRYSQAGEN